MLETPRLLLRPWRESDHEPFQRMNADPRVMEFYAAPLSPAESDRMQAHIAQHRFGFFAAELRATGEFIGFAGMSHVPFEAHFTHASRSGGGWPPRIGIAASPPKARAVACATPSRSLPCRSLHRTRQPSLAPRHGKTRHVLLSRR